MSSPIRKKWLKAILANLKSAVILMNPDGVVVSCSPSVENILGFAPDDLIGSSVFALCPDDPDLLHDMVSNNLSSKKVRVKCLDFFNKKRDTEMTLTKFDQDSGLEGVMLEIRDISTQVEAEDRFRLAFETSPDAIAITTLGDGIYVDINQGFVSMSGYEKDEIVGQSSLEVHIWPDDTERDKLIVPLQRDGKVVNQEITYKTKTGQLKPGLISANYIEIAGKTHIISITKDIDALKQAEEKRFQLEKELHQVQKLEAIGRLAGGIAHDFNNLLTVILGNVDLGKRQLESHQHGAAAFSAIEDAAKRASLLTSQLLAFSRKQDLDNHIVNLRELWQGARPLLKNSLREDIHLTCQIDPDLWQIISAPTQIELVLLNLFVNAKDAMPGGGSLHIEMKNKTCTSSVCHTCGMSYSGRGVQISVEDNGVGMDKDTLQRIFEPFFTTKDLHRGTGLGLSTVFGIVKKAKGHIQVHSQKGKGTRFEIWLPATDSTEQIHSELMKEEKNLEGTALIWVIEDDPMVRETTCHILRQAGYEVRVASRPNVAKQWVDHAFDSPELVLCDVIMPEMKGPELIDFFKQKGFHFRVLYVSGYPHDMIHGERLLQPCDTLLPKPFSSQNLLEAVHTNIYG